MFPTRRDFLKTSAFAGLSLFSLADALDRSLLWADTVPASSAASAPGGTFRFCASNDVTWRGLFGDAYDKSLARLAQPPIDSVDFILADVNFNQKRRFTNYSGDISGRYIEVASLTSKREKPFPAILPEVVEKIVAYQNEDGHYGAPVDWSLPVDIAGATDQSLVMPILWGNGRLLLGLLAAYERFGDEKAFSSAKKMADFYIATVIPRFCDPARVDEYSPKAAGYAAAYVTCVFHGIEGLVRAYRLAGDKKYLDAAVTMADFHERFDTLPVGHSHGSISAHEALMMIYEETGDKKYLNRVVERWERAYGEGYVNPCGGVAEQYVVGYGTDEGCSESDLLRLNLMLWRDTGETKYLDFAERLLFNAYLANQWPGGGFGHRHLSFDEKGVFAWRERVAESYWCCSYHGPLGYYEFKEFLAVAAADRKRLLYHFPLDFTAPISLANERWTIESKTEPSGENVPVRTTVTLASDKPDSTVELAVRIPDWAERVIVRRQGRECKGAVDAGYWSLAEPLAAGTELEIDYVGHPFLEDRRFHKLPLPEEIPAQIEEAVLRFGPNVYLASESDGESIEPLTLRVRDGHPVLPESVSCMAKMNDDERAKNHAFVFRLTVERA